MSYFSNLPNIQYQQNPKGNGSLKDFSTVKNLFKRAKVREDIFNNITNFEKYEIQDGDRPDTLAKRFYNDSSLDWIIKISNNIVNLNDEWPLDNDSLNNYMLDKYGSTEKLAEIHHYETIEYKDVYGRIVIPGGLKVDTSKSETIVTTTDSTSYFTNAFPSPKANTVVSVNLNQKIVVYNRSGGPRDYNITNIDTNTSYLEIPTHANKNDFIEINILNNLANWPNGWGGNLTVYLRDGSDFTISIDDVILDNKVRIPARLFEFTGTIVDGVLQPTFNFTNETE
ncbi:MAG: baseplate wedge protein 53 [Pelagibacteraceae bacterium]